MEDLSSTVPEGLEPPVQDQETVMGGEGLTLRRWEGDKKEGWK